MRIIAGFIPLDWLLDTVSIGTLVAFMVVAAGVIILRRRAPDLERTFKVPLYPVLPLLFWPRFPMLALWGLAGPATQALITHRVDPHEQGRLQGAVSSLASLAGIFGPALFTQVRIGEGGHRFLLLKLRTMRVDADSSAQWACPDDPRMTRVGAWLRRTHLDELPQLINVLRGEMSLVGPRPALPKEVAEWTDDNGDFSIVLAEAQPNRFAP